MAFGKRKINQIVVSQSLSAPELSVVKGGIGAAGWDDTDDVSVPGEGPQPTTTTTTGPSIGAAGWDEE